MPSVSAPPPILPSQLADLERALRLNKYIPQFPTPKQAGFLLLPQREAFFGGAGGPGKSSAILMGGLQDVHVPKYAGLILRRNYQDLALPGALMDRALDWLLPTDAHWSAKDHTWEFPSGATLTFGYLEHENDKYRYKSAEFQYIAFDELTAFSQTQYQYMFTRLRRLEGMAVPLRMRSASNPGDVGHAWVKRRFVTEGRQHGRPYIPALLRDNPHLDEAAYRESLSHVDPVTRAQIEDGNWDILAEGNMFKRGWFTVVRDWPRDGKAVRYWDFAATEASVGTDPDWTVGLKMVEKDGRFWIVNIQRDRLSPLGVEALLAQTAQVDGHAVSIHLEQEPGSSGKTVAQDYQRRVLRGFTVHIHKPSTNKEERAKPVSSAAEASNVFLVDGPWVEDFLDEVAPFPGGAHDDQVDCLSGAHGALTGTGKLSITRL